jgi:hypothetical protein
VLIGLISQKPIWFCGVFIFTSAGWLSFSQRFSCVEARVPSDHAKLPSNDDLVEFFRTTALPALTATTSQSVFHIAPRVELVTIPAKNLYHA